MGEPESRAIGTLLGTGSRLYRAECVTFIAATEDRSIHGSMVHVDREARLVHVFDHLGATHLFTAPLGRTLIEWHRSSERGGERRTVPDALKTTDL